VLHNYSLYVQRSWHLGVVTLDRHHDLLLGLLHVRRVPHTQHPCGHREVDHAERALVVDDLDAADRANDEPALILLPLAKEPAPYMHMHMHVCMCMHMHMYM
jgi:hypothetical protein